MATANWPGPSIQPPHGWVSSGASELDGPQLLPRQGEVGGGAETSADAPFLVDIGGSIGHDLAEFRTKHPNTPGRLILEDLPVVIGQIKELDESIERVEYDFHTEQPHKGEQALLDSISCPRFSPC